jgi:hypothetical protein
MISKPGSIVFSTAGVRHRRRAIVPRYTIDRFEGSEWAVLQDENGRTFTVPRDWLPSGVREGDVLKQSGTAESASARAVRFELDPDAREEQLAKARAQRDALPRGPKGDISL